MNQRQIKTRKDCGVKDIFGIGLLQENFQSSKEPNRLEMMKLFTFHLNENSQFGTTFAADKIATQLETLLSRNGIPFINHRCNKSKIVNFLSDS